MLHTVQQLLNDDQLYKLETVQNLWSGYGEISRYFSPQLKKPVIVKHIAPPVNVQHPRGWNTQASHQRKLQSYQVEKCFYRDYAPLCQSSCRVPNLLAHVEVEQGQILVLEDLDYAGLSERYTQLTIEQVKRVISWLANFHGKFIGTNSAGLWPFGTYWHLATRQDELHSMQGGSLKNAALAIDKALNAAEFQTLVHGDAKVANFCFADVSNSDPTALAAVDFQYVGRGVGVKDLAYLLGSCLSESQLVAHEEALLEHYFSQLAKGILEYQDDLNFVTLERSWRSLYSFAWADFHRFLLGWSPEHFKINAHMQSHTNIVLGQL